MTGISVKKSLERAGERLEALCQRIASLPRRHEASLRKALQALSASMEEIRSATQGQLWTPGLDPTRHKHVEEALRESNELLEAVFSSMHLMIAHMDREFNFIRVNRAYAEADGREPDFFAGKNHFDLYPNEENQEIFRRVVDTATPYFAFAKPFEYAQHPERGVTYWDWGLFPVKDAAGRVTGVVLNLLNVTDRQRAKEALWRTEELLRMVLEALPLGVWVADKEGRLVLVNPAAREIQGGADPLALERLDLCQWWWTETGTRIEAGQWPMQRALLNGEASIDAEMEIEALDGRRKRLLASAVPVQDAAGRTFGGVMIAEDMTDRKRAEARTKATYELLRLFVKESSLKGYLDEAVRLIQGWSGCRCVGIRVLREDGFIPYESYVGFDPEFLESENWLSIYQDHCACIRVIAGTEDPHDLPAMTPGGSFRSDHTLSFVERLSGEGRERFRGVCVENGFLSVAVIPLRFKDKILGAIHLADEREGMVPAEAVEFLEGITPLVGEAILRFTVEEELVRSQRVQEFFNALLGLALEDLDFQGLLQRITDLFAEAGLPGFGSESVILLAEEESGRLTMRAHSGHPEHIRQQCARVPLGECLCGRAAVNRKVEFGHCRHHGHDGDCEAMGPHGGECAVPLCAGEKLIGVIHLHSSEGGRLSHKEEQTLLRLADVVVAILERKRAEEALRRSEAELREMSARLLTAQEDERRAVAHDVHDSLGSSLVALKYRMENIRSGLVKGRYKAFARELEEMASTIQENIQEVRRIQRALRPPILDDLGIVPAISWFTREFENTYRGIRIEKEMDIQESDLSDLLKTVIFRIVQEGLNNIAKHSHANLVHLSLLKSQNRIDLAIRDDGLGFDVGEAISTDKFPRGMGIHGMRERVELSGGSFELESVPGRGTSIRASWPLRGVTSPPAPFAQHRI
ncbi:MAG: PAS domain-containing protein [Thermodesulfobacteriota bacterium]